MCFGLYDPSRVLTFDGSGVEVEWNSEEGTAPWLMLSLSGTMNVTNGAKVAFTVDSGNTGNRNAIYMNAGAAINVTNGSTFIIKGNETAGKEGQGIQLDKTGQSKINVTGNSTFLIDGTNRGYVNSPSIYVEDSTFTVQNCTANASNGGDFTAVNSTVTYQDNKGHGLSADNVTLKNSTLTADHNGYYGARSAGEFLVDGTSILTVTNNSNGGDYAGLKLTSNVKDGKVEAGAVVTITDNYCSGLSNNGKCVFEEGSKLTITNNNNDKGTSSHGGGIYNSGASAKLTLPSDAIIYNNHSKTDSDDIYNSASSTITFPAVGSSWVLDDCGETIDGWYDDSENARWNVHNGDYHADLFEDFNNGVANVSGPVSLKAAHAETATVQPADITIYMGGTDGYEGVADGSGEIQGSNSLPEPGYYITLPYKINQALKDDGYTVTTEDGTQPSDLSELITIRTVGADKEYLWTLHKYGNTYSAALGKYIYAIVPKEDTNTDPFRLTFSDGENVIDQDNFKPAEENTLQAQYQMDIYSELVNARQVFLEVSIPGHSTYYCNVSTQPGTLNVRYVTGSQESVVTPAYTDIVHASDADDPNKTALDKAYVIKTPGTKFYINSSDVDVTEGGQFAQVSLLFDDIVSSANTEGVENYKQLLTNKAIQNVAGDLVNVQSQAKYLDLVDANNGNTWLTASQPVTVYWPYPEGTDANTDFRLVHFEGLDRDMATDEVSGQIDSTAATTMELKKDAYGISFTTQKFSPFVLVWGDQPAKEEGSQPTQTPVPTPTTEPEVTPTPAPVAAVIPQTGDESQPLVWVTLVVVSGAALAGLAVYRKKRSDK
ncbi:right-handed parallel beta-helix repeat-containing protein [uncultured Subdoligranulum sp.]|uniref:right-handed parallel beta-helix repeat-containing protein n=1 Tax=uncultured Subdoligranulum sp. TaxID=512298 RepID=UPI0026254338|nr:right-handed parallel beta-helix repeat-containing protein [uncultured Subdoligranulum sp.]